MHTAPWLFLLAHLGVSTPATHQLLVLPLEARHGVDRAQVHSLSDVLVAESRRIPGFRVIAQEDLEKMLSMEVKRQLAGCDATSCLAEIAGGLNADEVLYGSVARLGQKDLVLSVSRINARTATPVGGQAERISGTNQDAMMDSIPRALKALFPGYTPPEPRIKPLNRAVLATILALSGSAVQYAAFASMFASVIFIPCPLLGVVSLGGSGVACCSGPFYVSALQTWIADLVGRRQAGFRRAIPAGVLAMGWVALHTALTVTAGALLGGVLGYLGPQQLPVQRAAVENVLKLFFLVPNNLALNGALLGGALGLWQGVALLVLGVPAAQAVAILASTEARPDGEDPARPALYAPYESPPGCLTILPCWLVGGGTSRSQSSVVLEEPPPAAVPVRSGEPNPAAGERAPEVPAHPDTSP